MSFSLDICVIGSSSRQIPGRGDFRKLRKEKRVFNQEYCWEDDLSVTLSKGPRFEAYENTMGLRIFQTIRQSNKASQICIR
jgi:hypothetical protein